MLARHGIRVLQGARFAMASDLVWGARPCCPLRVLALSCVHMYACVRASVCACVRLQVWLIEQAGASIYGSAAWALCPPIG